MDTDTEEVPMELTKDHPAAVEDSGEEDTAGGDSADPDAAEGEDAPEDGGNDPDGDPEPATAADTPPPEPHYKKQVHRLNFVEGPIPALLWRAIQRIGFPLRSGYEAHLYKNAQQEEEWLVTVVISIPDKYGSQMEYYKHFDDVPRRTLDAGTSEAARRALCTSAISTRRNSRAPSFSSFHAI